MKTNLLRIIALCIICAATIMSGCVDDIQDSTVDKALEKAPENVLFSISFDGGQHDNPYLLRVVINEGGTAMILADDTSGGEKISYGSWEIYRETKGGDMYDVTYDDTELRIILKDDNVALGHIYENGFTKCGEPFYGSWMANPLSTTVDESTPIETATSAKPKATSVKPTPTPTPTPAKEVSGLPVLPVVATLVVDPKEFGSLDDLYVMEIILYANGVAKFATVGSSEDWSETGTWELYRTQGPTSRQYDLFDCTPWDFSVTMRYDRAAVGEMNGVLFRGEWEPGTKSTFDLSTTTNTKYKMLNWQTSASYFEYTEGGVYTGNSDDYTDTTHLLYTDKTWEAGRLTTVEDILDEMGIQYDNIEVVSEVVNNPPMGDHQRVDGKYEITGSQIETIKLTVAWTMART